MVFGFSLYGFLVVENSQSWTLANLFLGTGLVLEGAAVLSYANQPTLAALLRLTSIMTMIPFVTVAGLEILYF